MAAASFDPSEEEATDKKFGLVADRIQLKPPDDLLVYKAPPSENWPKFPLPVPATSCDPSSEDVTEQNPLPYGYWIFVPNRNKVNDFELRLL